MSAVGNFFKEKKSKPNGKFVQIVVQQAAERAFEAVRNCQVDGVHAALDAEVANAICPVVRKHHLSREAAEKVLVELHVPRAATVASIACFL